MRSACLAVTENKEAHTAENYRSNVDEVLEDFEIKLLNKRRLCLSGESVNMQLFLKDNL